MEQEREIEHFGFSNEHVSVERRYYVKKIINNALDGILNKIVCSEVTNQRLLEEKDKVFQNIWQSIEDHVKHAEVLDKKYFSVPEHVLLPAYFDHEKSYSESDEKKIDEQIEMHKKAFLENSIMLASLKLENSQMEAFLPFLNDELNVQSTLKESFRSLNMKEINELVEKTLAFAEAEH
ncbi:mis12 [Haematobia irritans]|uniref:mis12 n=1 Tax=Haematobia irritans TaxID=7368 RepID=UPI003F4F822A